MKKKCLRCGVGLESYSPMRKWCFDCRKVVSLEQAKTRKIARMRLKKQKN
ncbi:hypothetical protein KY335_03320 [Candidatus Woesearchaeota archaeon]|nr:hypothetical protein [Candidatus Woesearchaeota archaeon]